MKKMPDDTPYLNARNIHNEREGSIIASRTMWQIFAIICLLITLSAVGGMLYVAHESKFIPYVIQVDKLGQALAVARADTAAPADPRVIHATLAAFITDARMVTPDVTVQRNAIFRMYAHLGNEDSATIKMNEYLNGGEDRNPFKRAAKEVVSTEITSVLQQSEASWQVDWTETVRDRQGVKKSEYRMRALLTVAVISPTNQTTEEQIRKNPLGIYIRDFNWSKQL